MLGRLKRDTLGGRPIIDRSGAMVFVTSMHAHIHDGLGFTARVYDSALAASATIYAELILSTDLAKFHLKELQISTTGELATFEILEAPTVTDGTTPIPIINRNRIDPVPSGVTAFSDPSGISGGVSLDKYTIGTGVKQAGGGMYLSDAEWVIKPGLKYVVSLTNNDIAAQILWIRTNWYEE